MKVPFNLIFGAMCLCGTYVVGQEMLPGAPEKSGLNPKTATIYVNGQNAASGSINNGQAEALGVAIPNDGNVLLGWEDDGEDGGDPFLDLEAVWSMFSPSGTSITPAVKQTAVQVPGESVTNNFVSFFRTDGSGMPGATAWGPKIHANLFGDGAGMGATATLLSGEVPELAAYNNADNGDFPAVQLLDNSGKPVRILTGVSSDYASRPGDIRIADWEFLATGNIVIVDESRQDSDLVDLYNGTDPAHHALFRIVDPTGKVVKAETLVSSEPVHSEIWHGVGVTKDGFGVRFQGPGGATVRLFDNKGNPTSQNIDLGTLTGHAEAAGGGRGDGTGFHGNGKDAYVVVSGTGTDAWVTVLNADGTLRYSKTVSDDLTLQSVGDSDAAIDPDGNVIVVYEGKYNSDNPRLVMGRRFDPTGKPMSPSFYVSEKELPVGTTAAAGSPRIAWRNGEVAIAWVSQNDATTGKPTVALRLFSTSSGSEVTISSFALNNGKLQLTWAGGSAPYTVQRKRIGTTSGWEDVTTTSDMSAAVAIDAQSAFLRVSGH